MSVIIDIEIPGGEVEIGHSVALTRITDPALIDFSLEANYNAFLGNTTAKAAPVRMPAQPLGGTPLFTGSLDYLYNNGRFTDELINPPGRTKAKRLATFLTLHADNPRPDGGFDRFQLVSVVFSTFPAITFDCYVDWWQELFLMPPSEAVQVVRAINVHVQHQYEDAITIHPMLRLARKEEVDLMYLYPTTASALPAKVYPTATNNSFRTCTVVTGTTSIVTARDRMIPDHQGMLPWNSLSNIGPPLLVCFLEEIMNEDLTLK